MNIKIYGNSTLRSARRTVLLFLFLSISTGAIAQHILYRPKSLAHYPLETTLYYPDIEYAKFTEVRTWDVSGHGRHGTIKDVASSPLKRPDANFTPVEFFPGKRTFISDSAGTGAYISIPDPYESREWVEDFTVCFWMYWDEATVASGRAEEILATKFFRIGRKGTKLSLTTVGHSGVDIVKEVPAYMAGQPGWYFCGIMYDNYESDLFFYRYRYDPLATYDRGPHAVGVIYSEQFYPGIVPSPRPARILGGNFKSAICHVQFFDRGLPFYEVNVERNAVVDMERGDTNLEVYPVSGGARHYPLDEDNLHEEMYGKRGTFFGNSIDAQDRFGIADRAISFSPNGGISIPDIFQEYPKNKGYTISFWMKAQNATSTPTDGIAPPFEDSDTRYLAYYGKNSSGMLLTGMQRVKDRLGILRYTDDRLNVRKPFYLWWYDPASVRNKTDWVHVVMVQHEDWQRTYVMTKNDAVQCDCDSKDLPCIANCPCYYTYQAIQDLSGVTEWGLGNRSGQAEQYMDEFRVYTYPMSAFEVKALHGFESDLSNAPLPGDDERKASPDSTLVREKPQISELHLAVHPNPTSGKLTLSWGAHPEGPVEIVLTDLSGRVLLQQAYGAGQIESEVTFRNLHEYTHGSGVYVLKVSWDGATSVYKVILY